MAVDVTSSTRPHTLFVELPGDDTALDLRLLHLTRRWPEARRIVLWARGLDRDRMLELLLEAGAGSRADVLILGAEEEAAALRAAREASCWIVTSPDLVAHLGNHQVGVYWPVRSSRLSPRRSAAGRQDPLVGAGD